MLFVVISIIIVFLAAYSSIHILKKAPKSQRHGSRKRLIFISGIIMGAGIWSMHFIGMLAYKMPMYHSYDSALTIASMVIAVIFSWLVFANITSKNFTNLQIVINAPLLGIGIALMHYMGMAAMKMDGRILYLPLPFTLSIMCAIIASAAALYILREIYTQHIRHLHLHILSASILTIGVCSLHYMGMEAAIFIPDADCRFLENSDDFWTAITVLCVSMFIILIGMFSIAQDTVKGSVENDHSLSKWHYIYYILAIFNAITVSASLYLNYQTTSNFEQVISRIAGIHEVEKKFLELDYMLTELTQQKEALLSDGPQPIKAPSPPYSTQMIFKSENTLQTKLINIELSLHDVIEDNNEFSPRKHSMIESIIELRPLIQASSTYRKNLKAASMIATSNHTYLRELYDIKRKQRALVSKGIALMIDTQSQLYEEKKTAIYKVKLYEYLTMGFMSIFILLATFYGRNVAAEIKLNEKERTRFQDELKISRDNLEKQVEEQTKEIRAESIKNALLGTIAENSNQSRTMESALKGALREVIAFTGWELGHVYLATLRNHEKPINVWYCNDMSDEIKHFIKQTNLIEKPLSDEVVPGLSFTSNQATWISDIEAHRTFLRSKDALNAKLKGMTAVPIIIFEECVGFMEFFSYEKVLPSFEIVLILERLSIMMVRVIEKFLTQESLKSAKEKAEEASSAKTEFLSNMSHELRTPMHAILRFSENGMDEVNSANKDELHEYFSDIHKSGQRLTKLINNLLDLTKLESTAPDISFSKQSLPMLNDHAIKELQSLLDEKQINVIRNYDDPPPSGELDGAKITQVIINLISNAIKFTPAGSNLTITISQQDDLLIYSISDQGDGIPEDETRSIFDKFIQSSKTKTNAGGTGLGLAICLEIITLHGGEITASNNPQEGSTFTFSIPINHLDKEEDHEGK